MHFLDILILCCIAGWGVLGFFTGLIAQLSLLLALGVSIACNWTLGSWIRTQTTQWFEQEWINWLVAFALSFILSLFIIKIIAAILKSLLGGEDNKTLDRILGGGFGAIKGAVLALFLIFCLHLLAKPETFDNTLLAPYALAVADWSADKLVDREKLAKLADEISNKIRENENENVQDFNQTRGFIDKLKELSDKLPADLAEPPPTPEQEKANE